ncbi:MAG: hypothetical protein ACTSXH_09815 [Promethearchaeota archaeon]
MDSYDILNGSMSLLVMIISVIIGLSIILNVFNSRKKIFIYWGLAYIGFYSPWWSSSLSFLITLITGAPLTLFSYIAIGTLSIPLFMTFFILGFTEMLYLNLRKYLLVFYWIAFIIAESFIVYYLNYDPQFLGTFTDIFDINYSPLILIYLLFINFSITIMGLLFAWNSLSSNDPLIKFKGKMLIIAFITYPICGIIDGGAVELNHISLVIVRLVLITGALFFYLGFFTPKFIAKHVKTNP